MKKVRGVCVMCILLILVAAISGCGNGNDLPVSENEDTLSDVNIVETNNDNSVVEEQAVSEQEDSKGPEEDTVESQKDGEKMETPKTSVSKDYIVTGDFKPSEGLEFESNGDGTCTLKGIGVCSDENLVIPMESPTGDKVTLIDEYAFCNLKDVSSITLVNMESLLRLTLLEEVRFLIKVFFHLVRIWYQLSYPTVTSKRMNMLFLAVVKM